ncbi:hypothetical protein ACFLYV_02230 [Chloroflexota bacterium]
MKHRFLFLWLTLACFLGIIAIFVVDGYMGVYDTVTITAGEQPQELGPEYWLRAERYWSTSVDREGTVGFAYTVDNHTFSDYGADVAVSVWQNQKKIKDVTSQRMTAPSFDSGEIAWSLDMAEIMPGDTPEDYGQQFTVLITRGGVERSMVIYVSPSLYAPKVPAVR